MTPEPELTPKQVDALREKVGGVFGSMPRDVKATLTEEQLGCALYEGLPHVQNLAEKLVRQHSKTEAIPFFDMHSEDEKQFWYGIARQLIEHATKG